MQFTLRCRLWLIWRNTKEVEGQDGADGSAEGLALSLVPQAHRLTDEEMQQRQSFVRGAEEVDSVPSRLRRDQR